MGYTGVNIKNRLYRGLNAFKRIKRIRYWRGHGVHSPYVYAIVREVFMCRKLKSEQRDLYDRLIALGTSKRCACELQNLMGHCHYSTFGIDCDIEQMEGYDMVFASLQCNNDTLQAMAHKATELRMTLCILAPAHNHSRHACCKTLINNHRCTSIDNRDYLLLFNNHLPKQEFEL